MIVFTRRLMLGKESGSRERGTYKSQFYFTDHTLTAKAHPFATVDLLRKAHFELFSPITVWLDDSTFFREPEVRRDPQTADRARREAFVHTVPDTFI